MKPPRALVRSLGCPSVLVGFLLLVTGCGPELEPIGPHPIILVDIDTLRADHLGVYGYSRATSPNLDAFAREAIRFEWAISQAPNTPPSQASILTSLYPSTHGMIDDDDRIADEVTTLAEVLQEHGFLTAGFIDGGYLSQHFGFNQGFSLYHDNDGAGLRRLAGKLSNWLREHHRETFLLWLHTYDVHTPYSPPEPFRSAFLSGLAPPTPGFQPTVAKMEEIRLAAWERPNLLPPNDIDYARACYDGAIRYVDDWFGKFLAELRELGLLERATIVFFSDHGEEFQEHGGVLHEKLYATVTRIPLLIRLPGGRRPQTIPQVVESIDLMPTLLELVGAPLPPGLQGKSLLPLLQQDPQATAASGRFVAISEFPFFGGWLTLTAEQYRLHHFQNDDHYELYDFRADPKESTNLLAEHPEEVQRLAQGLDLWRAKIAQKGAYQSKNTGLPSETLEQLKALGYIR